MKQCKKLLIMVLLVCLMLSQAMVVSAKKTTSSSYKVTLNKTVYTMKKGKTLKLKATLNKAAKGKKVVWSTSNKKVATVTSNGKVKAKKNGKATITAKIKGTKVKATCKIVVGTPVSKVKLDKKSLTLEPGETYKLKTTISPKKPTNKKVTYKSSNASIVKVSSKGKITALKEGKAKITVTAADGSGKKATCTVTVAKKTVAATSVTISDTNVNLEPGQKKQLSATISPANTTDKSVTWSSGNTAVVTVNNSGEVTAVGEGTATITVKTANGLSASCAFKVSYKSTVSNQAELNNALNSKVVTNIVYSSNNSDKITIPKGNYKSKTIEINAPNSEIINNGQLAKVTVNASSKYTENGSNVIYFNATKGHLSVDNQGNATINLSSAGNQDISLNSNGCINDLQILGKTKLNISGTSIVPVTIRSNAANSSISTSTELSIVSSAKWNMTVFPGGENTKARVDNKNCLPAVAGVGCIQVTVTQEQDIVHVPAEMDENLGIDQKVAISGNVQEYDLVGTTVSSNDIEGTVSFNSLDYSSVRVGEGDPDATSYDIKNEGSQGTSIYLLPYAEENCNINGENCDEFIREIEPVVVTDEEGNYCIQNVTIGNYWLIVKKDNCKTVVQNVIITSQNSESFANSMISLMTNDFASISNAESISGTVKDGLTGNSINTAGIQVKLRAGNGNIIGEVLQSTVTDENGKYVFTDIPTGIYTVEAIDLRQNLDTNEVRYNPANVSILVASPYLKSDEYNIVINQQMQSITGTGLVQFTLEWGTEESGASSDIDSHLIGPRNGGTGVFHVYYGNESYEEYEEYEDKPLADLDVDDVTYEGPEHTTIYQEAPGIYRFYIHNFSERNQENSDMMAKSSVRVTVTIGTNTYTYYCPNQIGNLWYVCDYNSNTHTIIPRNTVSTYIGDESNIGMTMEELNALYLESAKSDAMDTLEYLEKYLSIYTENDAKNSYISMVADWKKQIEECNNYLKARELENVIYDEYDQLREQEKPVISASNLFESTYAEEYDGEKDIYSRVLTCKTLFGNSLEDLAVAESEEFTATVEEATDTAEADYSYIIHVTYKNGLICDYKVRLASAGDYIASTVQEYIENCNLTLGMFDDCEDIQSDKATLNEIQNNITQITSIAKLDEVCNTISEIEARYANEIYIETVSTAVGIEDWWTYTRRVEENGQVIRKDAVLVIEHDEDVTEEDILKDLQIGFACDAEDYTFTYEIQYLENDPYYVALLKVTNGETGHVKNIYVDVQEW